MSIEAIHSSVAGPKPARTAYDPNQTREKEVLRETLQRSFPEMASDRLDESIAVAFKFAGTQSNRMEIIGLARIFLARHVEPQGAADVVQG